MPEKQRFTDPRTHRYDIAKPSRENPVLVKCPNCEEKAAIVPDSKVSEDAVKLVCSHCGFSKRSSGKVQLYYWRTDRPADSYFGCPLWLQTPCCGNTLWAFSEDHLRLLEGYISAELREREEDPGKGWRNASVVSRLPKWMTSSSNRNEVKKKLRVLRDKL